MRITQTTAIACCLFAGSATAQVPIVVTDIPPVHSLVAQVMGGLGEPVLLLEQGSDAHDFQLRPSQARAIADAQLVIWIGPQMSPWLDRARYIAADAKMINLLDGPGIVLRDFDASDAHGRDDQSPENPSAGQNGPLPETPHDTSELDPHAWLDPDNAAIWLGRIADELSVADPGNSVSYRANASLAQASITALEADLRLDLERAQGEPIIVSHDALGYFADQFGLTIAATLADGHAADPGAARLSDIRAMLESGTVSCIFPEVASDTTRIETLAEGTAVGIGDPLDPEGRTIAPGAGLYESLLVKLAATISDCLEVN